jgi:hypothetical protein
VFALALSGEINQKRVMPLGAWLLISAGIALATTPPQFRRFLIVGLTVIGAISWFGIASRRFYPTPRSLEPWQQIAQVAASSVLSNQIVIGSHPVFLFYLTRDLMTLKASPPTTSEATMPSSCSTPASTTRRDGSMPAIQRRRTWCLSTPCMARTSEIQLRSRLGSTSTADVRTPISSSQIQNTS